jgi:hypothetical protein
MLAAIELDRKSVYIANIVPWRPPGNRTPTPQETAICLPFTQRQIELVDPDVLVCLGNPSTQTLLATKEGITRTRGRWFRYQTGTREIRAMPTFHPAFLLRNAISKRLAWRDFLAIKKTLAAAEPRHCRRWSLRLARVAVALALSGSAGASISRRSDVPRDLPRSTVGPPIDPDARRSGAGARLTGAICCSRCLRSISWSPGSTTDAFIGRRFRPFGRK